MDAEVHQECVRREHGEGEEQHWSEQHVGRSQHANGTGGAGLVPVAAASFYQRLQLMCVPVPTQLPALSSLWLHFLLAGWWLYIPGMYI